MIDADGLLMIEPTWTATDPLVDRRTMRMAAAMDHAVASEHGYRGVHVCMCGVKSGNRDLYIDGVLTNSLAVHYLAWHRKDVPAAELAKVDALPYGLRTPTAEDLKAPPNHKLVMTEAPNIRLSSPKKPKVKPKPKKPTRRPSYDPFPGEGRTKVIPPGSNAHMNKVVDDLVRMFYYTFKGYEGPHPWGTAARPPQPEYRPLPLKDKQHGAAYRILIDQYFKQPKVKARWQRTLYELRQLLMRVDPKNPKLKPTVIIDV